MNRTHLKVLEEQREQRRVGRKLLRLGICATPYCKCLKRGKQCPRGKRTVSTAEAQDHADRI